jgi:hypothetical protein
MDRIAGNKETAILQSYAETLQRSIQRNRYIPGPGDWAQVIAAEAGVDVGIVAANDRRYSRVLLVDPSLQVGTNGGGLPFRQTISGSVVTNITGQVVPPVSLRLMILSTMGTPFPAVITNTSMTMTYSAFNAIWDTPERAVPTGLPWSSWQGHGDDLKIQRINLTPLFVRLMLNNYASPGPGQYSIDRLATNTVPAGSVGVNAFFIKDTVLGLYTHTGTMDSQQILARDCTYVYDLGAWRSSIFQPPPVTPPVMEYLAELFTKCPWNMNASGSPATTQYSVLDAMEAYMNAYIDWAALGTFPGGSDPTKQLVTAKQNALNQALLNLKNSPVAGQGQMLASP